MVRHLRRYGTVGAKAADGAEVLIINAPLVRVGVFETAGSAGALAVEIETDAVSADHRIDLRIPGGLGVLEAVNRLAVNLPTHSQNVDSRRIAFTDGLHQRVNFLRRFPKLCEDATVHG